MYNSLLLRFECLFSQRDDMFPVSKPTFMYIGLMTKQEEFVNFSEVLQQKAK